MASETTITKVLFCVDRPFMRVVTRAAPHPSAAPLHANAKCQLLDMAHYLDRARRGWRLISRLYVNREYAFEFLAGMEITELVSRIQDANFPTEMTLLANAIARSGSESDRVDDIAAAGLTNVRCRIAVAPIT